MTSHQDGIKPEKEFKPLLGAGALVIFGDVDAKHENEFNNWYMHQHLPERIGIPGFLRGRRFITVPGPERKPGAKYFTLYETETLDTLASEPYILRLNNPSAWTRKIGPQFRARRIACRVTISMGAGTGGYAATIEFRPSEGKEDELRGWLRSDAIPSSLKLRPNLVAIHLMEEDESTTKAKDQTEEGKSKRSRTHDLLARWVLMAEGMSDSDVTDTCRKFADEMAARGANSDTNVNCYQLLGSLS